MKIALSIIITLLFGKEVISVSSIVIFFRNKKKILITLTQAEARRHTQIRSKQIYIKTLFHSTSR